MQFQLFYHLAIFCGLRKGELIALEWSDLNFTENSVSITKSTSMIAGEMITKNLKQIHLSEKYLTYFSNAVSQTVS